VSNWLNFLVARRKQIDDEKTRLTDLDPRIKKDACDIKLKSLFKQSPSSLKVKLAALIIDDFCI